MVFFNEQKQFYTVKNIFLKDETLNLKIDAFAENETYILKNFHTLFKTEDEIKSYSYFLYKISFYFIPEIVNVIRNERIIVPIVLRKIPDVNLINKKRIELKNFLHELSDYLNNHYWFSGNCFGYCDIQVATALAVLDYLGEISWKTEAFKSLEIWYLNAKSRQSFQIILNQRCQGIMPHMNFDKITI